MTANLDGLLYDADGDVTTILSMFPNVASPGNAAFHAQQAAEKMVKHVFELNGVEYQKIHNISILLKAASMYGWLRDVTQDELEMARLLSNYAVIGRYAGASVTKEHALQAIRWSNQIADILERNGYPVVRINV